MNTLRIGVCVSAFSLLIVGLTVSESKASGPVAAQLAVAQVQSGLTDASVACRRCWGRRGFYGGYYGGYGGYGYGGYAGYGYGGYGGYGYRSYGMGYSYPAYSYVRYSRPVYYSGSYGYSPSYYGNSCNCGGYGYYSSYQQPAVYSVSSYSSPYQYSSPTVYSSSGSLTPTYSSPVYSPTYTSPTVISAPTPNAPPTTTPASSQAPAPYPAPPTEYTQPSAYRAPIATLPVATASSVYSQPQSSQTSMILTPAYSPNYASSAVAYNAYSPATYNHSAGSPIVNRLNSGNSPW